MKKESVIAVILGIVLGLATAFGIVGYVRRTQTATSIPTTTQNTAQPKAVGVVEQGIELSEPAEKAVMSKNTVALKGTVPEDSLVVIQSPLTDKAIEVEGEKFSTNFPLAIGENVITLTAYPKDTAQRTKQKTITIYYIDEE